MLEKLATIKRFEYLLLSSELLKKTDLIKKQHQGLDEAFSSNKDNTNMNQSLIKKEAFAKTKPKKKI